MLNHQDLAYELKDAMTGDFSFEIDTIAQTGTVYAKAWFPSVVDEDGDVTDSDYVTVRIADHGDAYGTSDVDISNGADCSIYFDGSQSISEIKDKLLIVLQRRSQEALNE